MTQTTEIDPTTVETLHDVEDQAKYRTLINSMTESGWTGAPIVIVERDNDAPLAITGTHRLAAAEFAGIGAPAVELRDLFTEAGIDYDAVIGEYLDGGFELDDAIIRAAGDLPAAVIEHYGLDAH